MPQNLIIGSGIRQKHGPFDQHASKTVSHKYDGVQLEFPSTIRPWYRKQVPSELHHEQVEKLVGMVSDLGGI